MKKKILIIGGAGFIGHNLAVGLKKNNFDVYLIDGLIVNNLNTVIGNVDNLPHPNLSQAMLNERFNIIKENEISLNVQDARDYSGLSHLINKISPNIIIHLAAVSHANRSNKDPFAKYLLPKNMTVRQAQKLIKKEIKIIEDEILYRCHLIAGNAKNSWSAKKIYQSCVKGKLN